MLNATIIRENFDPKLITALFKNFSSQYVALLELIDNAVDDRQQNEKLIVSIDYNPEDAKLILKNFNGKGMSIDDLERFFTWGRSDKTSGKIGRYGQGGKAALGYLAKSFNIKSHPKNKLIGFSVKIKDWENRDAGFTDGFEVSPYNSLHDEGDVTFEIYNLKKDFDTDLIMKRLTKIYRPLIEQQKVEFIVDNKVVNCAPINYEQNTYHQFNIPFYFFNSKLILNGEYGLVADPHSERGGFKIYQYGRNVAEKEYFGHTDPSKRWNVERLYGELYIDFDLPISMNKTEIDRDSELWHLIAGQMHDELKKIIKQAADYKTPTKSETKAVGIVNKKIKNSDNGKDVKIDFTNYGPRVLFKVDHDDEGTSIIKLNRDHTAYKMWSQTELGKKYYSIMIYALTETTKAMSSTEASKLLSDFSLHLGKKSSEILS